MRFIDLFLMHVNEQPDHLALVDEAGSLTYKELDERAETLAQQYANKGIGAGDAVGVKVPYSKDLMIHAVAIHKLGAVYVPIDNDYPDDRVKYMREDSTREKHTSTGTDDDVAMIIYTSGTTGRPKGVVHTHKSLMEIIHWLVPHPGEEWLESQPVPMSPQTRCGIVTGFSFLGTNITLFSTIAAGGTLYFANQMERLDTNSLYQFLIRKSITHIFMASSLGMAMVEGYDTSSTLIMVGGEKLHGFKSKAGQRLLNIYGSTEGAMVCNAYVDGTEKDIPIGKTCPGVITHVVDENMNDVPQGEVGELIYSAGFMAREYLHLPEQTNAKWFYLDSNTQHPTRYYHTGDRVRQDTDGNIYCLGRTDNMVKVRGYRVETGEVERQISLVIPNTELVVVLRRVHGIDHLVCFYEAPSASTDSAQAFPGGELDTTALKNEISKSLAEYMVPDIWVRMDKFPRNTNGKVIRNELQIPSSSSDRLSVIHNEVEMRVVEAARLILGNTISLDDNFFEYGGTSLGAIKLAAQLRDIGIHITGSKIMQLKMLRKVAAEADVDYKRLWTPEQWQNIQDSFASRGEKIQKVAPLSTEYEDMLIRYLMHPVATTNSNVYALKMDSQIEKSLLRSIISDLTKEYEFLRLFIVIHHHFPFQIVYTDQTPTLETYDVPINHSDPSTYKEDTMLCVKEVFKHIKHTPYDPETDSMVRFAYIDTPDGFSFLLMKTMALSVTPEMARTLLYKMMEKLSEHYPDDVAIRDWREILGLENLTTSKHLTSNLNSIQNALDEVRKIRENGLIRIYSTAPSILPLKGTWGALPSVCFVHTGNTGSDAYYHLADKIGDYCAFSVIEPYNLFHKNDIQHGIKAIARKYVEILRDYQPQGPYIVGGWCYGGVVAHEMACQLQAMGETVSHLIMFDSHALAEPQTNAQHLTPNTQHLRSLAKDMMGDVNREYFETCPLFQDLREQGLLEAMVLNSAQVNYDLQHHTPSMFHGPVTYFKPLQTPMAATGKALEYWKKMMEFDAGNFENFCDRESLRIFNTPHEHDLMMDDESLAVTVPILKDIFNHTTS